MMSFFDFYAKHSAFSSQHAMYLFVSCTASIPKHFFRKPQLKTSAQWVKRVAHLLQVQHLREPLGTMNNAMII
jgi:hypothetical protein